MRSILTSGTLTIRWELLTSRTMASSDMTQSCERKMFADLTSAHRAARHSRRTSYKLKRSSWETHVFLDQAGTSSRPRDGVVSGIRRGEWRVSSCACLRSSRVEGKYKPAVRRMDRPDPSRVEHVMLALLNFEPTSRLRLRLASYSLPVGRGRARTAELSS